METVSHGAEKRFVAQGTSIRAFTGMQLSLREPALPWKTTSAIFGDLHIARGITPVRT